MSKTRQIDKIQCAKTLILSLQQVSEHSLTGSLIQQFYCSDNVSHFNTLLKPFFLFFFVPVIQRNAVWAGSRVRSLVLCVLWNQRVGPSVFSNLWSRPSQNQRRHRYAAQVRFHSAPVTLHCSSHIFGLASGNCHVRQMTLWIVCFLWPCFFLLWISEA